MSSYVLLFALVAEVARSQFIEVAVSPKHTFTFTEAEDADASPASPALVAAVAAWCGSERESLAADFGIGRDDCAAALVGAATAAVGNARASVAGAAAGRRVEIAVTPAHTFAYDADAPPGRPSGALAAAARAWCESNGPSLLAEYGVGAAADALAGGATAGAAPIGLTGRNGLTEAFLESAEAVYSPPFGTEQMAPLLHALIRFHRPNKVVELGYGYTTPFLARALADNAENSIDELNRMSERRNAGLLQRAYYENLANATAPRLYVIDDGSQRQGEAVGGSAREFADTMRRVLEAERLDKFVELRTDAPLDAAHAGFAENSLGLVWNDAQWSPEFLQKWWPLLEKDGGLLLLHNVVGNGEKSRWCVAPPRRVMKRLFPNEKFEFITLMEPNKVYQGSVAILRRLDPARKPEKYMYPSWGGIDNVRTFTDWNVALDRR